MGHVKISKKKKTERENLLPQIWVLLTDWWNINGSAFMEVYYFFLSIGNYQPEPNLTSPNTQRGFLLIPKIWKYRLHNKSQHSLEKNDQNSKRCEKCLGNESTEKHL